MALRRIPTRSLEVLIRERLPDGESSSTRTLIERLRAARERGYLTQGEFRAACRWKSPRSAGHIARNSHHRVRAATSAAICELKDRDRIEPLLALHGVSVPTASAILALLDPDRYGVIDIRVWQLLHRLGFVEGAQSGTGLTAAHWEQFLAVIRGHAATFEVTARDVERALFDAHRDDQQGTLYRKKS